MATIKILVPFIGNVNGKSVGFTPDEVVEIPDADADHFVRGKYAKYVRVVMPETPAVKIQDKPKAITNASIKGGKTQAKAK